MTGFRESVQKGLAANATFAAARREMAEVLQAASTDVSSVLGVEVKLEFQDRQRSVRTLNPRARLADGPAPSEKYMAIVATAGTHDSVELAEAKFNELGYPVVLRWDDEFPMASDRTGFETVIQDLLASRATGAKLKSLLGRP